MHPYRVTSLFEDHKNKKNGALDIFKRCLNPDVMPETYMDFNAKQRLPKLRLHSYQKICCTFSFSRTGTLTEDAIC